MSPKRRSQSGMTLIEVLVAILIFSFGLLGFVGLQSRAIQYSVGAEDSNRAALLANEMATKMVEQGTVNPADSRLGYADWQTRVSTTRDPVTHQPNYVGLAGGVGTVSLSADGRVATIMVTWPSTTAGASPSASGTTRYVTQVILPQ